MKRASWLVFLVPFLAWAVDPPHDWPTAGLTCTDCHTPHTAPGGTLTSTAGNANLCLSCHVIGGLANSHPFYLTDQAYPWPGLRSGQTPSGTSHRWDSSAVGHVKPGTTNTSTGTVVSGGTYTGRYPKTYTISITQSGDVGAARFSWSATSPPGGSGSNLLTGTNVALDEGITVTFKPGTTSPAFVAGDVFYLYVRPDLRNPTLTSVLQRLENGRLTCSACHDQHSQAAESFDPQAPAYAGSGTGNGRHYQRTANNVAQICEDCHAARTVTLSSQGSHPVAVSVPTTSSFKQPTQLPLDKTTGKVRCLTCHKVHYAPANDGAVLRLTSHKALCQDCHVKSPSGSNPIHASTTNGVLWPGGQYGSTLPARPDASQRGACTQCHAVHGWPNNASPSTDYKWLLADSEENLCFTCHDGAPVAANVRGDFLKTYKHPATSYSGRHQPNESTSSAFGTSNRHAECTDCHNPHQAEGPSSGSAPPTISALLKGASGVAVTNGAAGTTPTYTFLTSAQYEYQVCFKCHSSWTSQPSGQTNLAVKLNPNNPSFHPVEAVGKNTGINANAFVNGWSSSSLTYCSSCHGSDGTVRGVHGSANQYILKRPFSPSSAQRSMSTNDLCFLCHRYDTYANDNATTTVKGYSRFNPPTFNKGHTFHVGNRRYPCGACHETHGSTTRPHLIVTGRSPGLTNYTHSSNGGTCYPTCHGRKTYTVNY